MGKVKGRSPTGEKEEFGVLERGGCTENANLNSSGQCPNGSRSSGRSLGVGKWSEQIHLPVVTRGERTPRISCKGCPETRPEEQWIPWKSQRPSSHWILSCWLASCFLNPGGIKTLELFAIYSSATPHSWPVDLDRLLSSWKEESSLD